MTISSFTRKTCNLNSAFNYDCLNVFYCIRLCVLGKRLLKDITMDQCNKNSTVMANIFCPNNASSCDPYYLEHDLTIVNGIRGLASGVFFSKYATIYKFKKILIYFCNLWQRI